MTSPAKTLLHELIIQRQNFDTLLAYVCYTYLNDVLKNMARWLLTHVKENPLTNFIPINVCNQI